MKDHIFELRRTTGIYDWSSQLHTQLKQLWNFGLKKKNAGLNGIRTHDLCDTDAVLYRLSYQVTGNWSLWVTNVSS